PKLVGMRIRDIEIKDIDDLEDFLRGNHIDIGVLCVPKVNAQKTCNLLVNNGVKGIWNFAPVDLSVPEDVIIENVHLSDSLLTLAYLLNEVEEEE
ncbi:MAG: redox-sensing transcriptional repressor Rex, partial [Clostridium sp.]